jgi:NAD(P)-dependent dehydrogenase (short-subunit alcohol dehydrogenase family)
MGARARTIGKLLLAGTVVGLAVTRLRRGRRARARSLAGQVALVTGGSRGLGLMLAQELAREGCRIAICARDTDELERARTELARDGVAALTLPCDVSDPHQVEQVVARIVNELGALDLLVNNASIIQVGPLEDMNLRDFQHVMQVNFWGSVHAALAAAAVMKGQTTRGRIVNITSIGGVLAMPHLLPYDCAKFAARGFSEGLHAELAQHGISVTTVIPGLMRTGSHDSALFKGQREREYGWFSLTASAPATSMDARRAARRIVRAAKLREAEVVLGWQAKLGRLAEGVFPGLVTRMLTLLSTHVLPGHDGVSGSEGTVPGRQLAALPGGIAAPEKTRT